MAPVFSPRSNLNALKWYGTLAGSANNALFMTFAFGMNAAFQAVYGKKDKVHKGLLNRFGLFVLVCSVAKAEADF